MSFPGKACFQLSLQKLLKGLPPKGPSPPRWLPLEGPSSRGFLLVFSVVVVTMKAHSVWNSSEA